VDWFRRTNSVFSRAAQNTRKSGVSGGAWHKGDIPAKISMNTILISYRALAHQPSDATLPQLGNSLDLSIPLLKMKLIELSNKHTQLK
jgi:hypothetical protein